MFLGECLCLDVLVGDCLFLYVHLEAFRDRKKKITRKPELILAFRFR